MERTAFKQGLFKLFRYGNENQINDTKHIGKSINYKWT